LESKGSVVIRVVHLKPQEKLEVTLDGELREDLVPKRISSPKILTLKQLDLRRTMFVYVFTICIVLWILSAFHAARTWHKYRSDRELLKTGVVPEGVVPCVMTYWRRDIMLQLWILLFIIGLVVFVLL